VHCSTGESLEARVDNLNEECQENPKPKILVVEARWCIETCFLGDLGATQLMDSFGARVSFDARHGERRCRGSFGARLGG
jgi:hypothetical protein